MAVMKVRDLRVLITGAASSTIPTRPWVFVLLQWAGDKLSNIRDFRHARYVIEGAEVVVPG